MTDNTNNNPPPQGNYDANRGCAPAHPTQFDSNAAYQNYINNYAWQKQQNENK